jgi:hypothetical protein
MSDWYFDFYSSVTAQLRGKLLSCNYFWVLTGIPYWFGVRQSEIVVVDGSTKKYDIYRPYDSDKQVVEGVCRVLRKQVNM